ncbi:hypothetical protein [Streptomyces colonosanans]|uniref:hypothetical protein n=1 Tax=Streptomyces colonosanans TaxID=1428652 RepID=UPI001FE712F7|nr:hypothetical protein [Streptomyces colonosanans]
MTTPAPETAAAAPFDPHDFPGDLVAAQHTEAELYAVELRTGRARSSRCGCGSRWNRPRRR